MEALLWYQRGKGVKIFKVDGAGQRIGVKALARAPQAKVPLKLYIEAPLVLAYGTMTADTLFCFIWGRG